MNADWVSGVRELRGRVVERGSGSGRQKRGLGKEGSGEEARTEEGQGRAKVEKGRDSQES